MKKSYTITLLVLLASFYAEAKIWRVNNNTGVNADFTNVQPAHDAALNGDTIMLEHSTASYGNLIAVKQLVILGTGYFLNENNGKQATLVNSKMGNIFLRNAYNPTTQALISSSAGSKIMGIEFGTIETNVGNYTVERCKFGSASVFEGAPPSGVFPVSNITFIRNYLNGIVVGRPSGVPGVLVNNVLIKNNIFFNPGALNVWSTGSAIVENNTFLASSTGNYNLYNSTFQNNISLSTNPLTFQGENSNVRYNVFTTSISFPGANPTLIQSNNLTNVSLQNTTVADPIPYATPAGFTSDNRFQLKPGSPALTAALGGGEVGAFGGLNPYILSGIPAIPTIYELEVPASGQNTLNVKMSIRSNQ